MKKLLIFSLISVLSLTTTLAQVIEITSDTTKLATKTGRFREAYRQGVRYAKGASGTTEITGTRVFRSLAELRRFTSPVEGIQYYLSEKGKEGYWYYDAADRSSADNTGTVLVTTSSKRLKRADVNQINCRWFLVGEGGNTADAIQAAINAGIQLSQDVLIPAGRWLVNKALVLDVPLDKTIRIIGQFGTILDFKAANASAFMHTTPVRDSTHVYGKIYLAGITFDGHRNPVTPGNAYALKTLDFRNCLWVELSNSTFQNMYGHGLIFRRCAGGIIDRNTFSGVYGRDSVYDAYGDAITLFDRSENFSIQNNTLRLASGQVGRCGIAVDVNCNYTTVINNNITGYERGIHVESSRHVLVTKNQVFRAPIGGYSAFNEDVSWEGNSFSAGEVTQPPLLSQSGVFFVYLDNKCSYRGNTISNWHGQKDVRGENTYLAKFWGDGLVIENNIFSKGNEVW
uniref:right-handed parallel beta-helix repeat-containing protein n=1 Tax=Siphonobacter sp. TaxID=1869184 RepID=UPI003B3A4562